jgi:hypothetical protein
MQNSIKSVHVSKDRTCITHGVDVEPEMTDCYSVTVSSCGLLMRMCASSDDSTETHYSAATQYCYTQIITSSVKVVPYIPGGVQGPSTVVQKRCASSKYLSRELSGNSRA